MIMDEFCEFADAVSVAGSAGTALIGDVYDTELASSDIGVADNLYLVIQVDTDIVVASSAGTIKFQLASDAAAAIATDGSATVHLDSGAIATGTTGSGKTDAGAYIFATKLPTGTYERYIGILATIATTAVSAGKINAFLTPEVPAIIAYPDSAWK